MAGSWADHSRLVAVDSMSYLKAAEAQQGIGSDTAVSTATGYSDWSGNFGPRTPLSSTGSLSRTPLSSRAKPFVSSRTHVTHVGWMPVVVNVEDCETQSYNEKVQEDVYLSSKTQQEAPHDPDRPLTPYSETLQEDVYLCHASASSSQHNRGRQLDCFEKIVIPSRTPSPPSESAFFPDVVTASASWISEAAEPRAEAGQFKQHPVKHTFIHYDTGNCEPEKVAAGSAGSGHSRRLVKSASAPNILLHDTFHVMQTMAERHGIGDCTPCAYRHGKVDGCRMGSDCKFCHMCDEGELKRRKKQKLKVIRERRQMLKSKNEAGKLCQETRLPPSASAPNLAQETCNESLQGDSE